MANFDLVNLALKATCPGNEIILDDKGLPSVMVRIPKFKISDVITGGSNSVHPAFIVNGVEVPEIYISKFQNVIHNGRAYSLPGEDPTVNVNFDTARQACEAKGRGWHLMTRAEWALLALWCKNNGFLPWGNNNYGKDTRETNYKAIPTYFDEQGRITRVATGTGPLTWSHDKSPAGIWDLNGNVLEWVGGMRLVYGELQVLVNNNAADSVNSQSSGSSEWKAIDGATGEFITPNGNGTTPNSLKLDYVSNAWKWISGVISDKADSSRDCSFESVTADEGLHEEAIFKLKALALLKDDNTPNAYEGDVFFANNGAAERLFFCGGYWHVVTSAGVFYLVGIYPRSFSPDSLGFRSAFIPGI